MTLDTARLNHLQARLDPLRARLLEHPIYARLDRTDRLRTFMQYHVFAVWDFMSLLKALQQRLCCVETPWLPPADGQGCRLVNEIVLGEESDDDGEGGYGSHYDLYHRSMLRCGADTRWIDRTLNEVRAGRDVASALRAAEVPESVERFVGETFRILETGDVCAIAAAFTFGRENLLPAVFRQIVDHLNAESGGELDDFKFYLDRHIQLDGDEHGPLAMRLVERLCGDDARKWQTVEDTAVAALEARRRLWDDVAAALAKD